MTSARRRHRSARKIAAALFLAAVQCAIVAGQDNAQVEGGAVYTKPRPLEFVTKTPSDVKEFGKRTFRKQTVPALLVIAGSTGLLMLMDQKLVNHAHHLGDQLNISHTNYQKTLFSVPVGKAKLGVEGPFDSGSALYFIGDGTVDLMIAGGLLGYGAIRSDNRALQTSSEIGEAVLAGGAVAQAVKHVTGRGSPFTTNESGGDWRTFPSPKKYQAHVSSYDAFPSGHLTASFATLTVLAENYPEHAWIRPVGYTLFTALGFEMLNNGVHWASDYPLAIALGYTFGKIAADRGRRPLAADQSDFRLFPYAGGGSFGAGFVCRFSGHTTKKTTSS